MIPSGVEVFIALAPIDLRWGFDRLAGLAQEQVGRSARSGALFVFIGKRKTALKVLFFDGTGMCLFYKRLDRRTFRVPDPPLSGATSIELVSLTTCSMASMSSSLQHRRVLAGGYIEKQSVSSEKKRWTDRA